MAHERVSQIQHQHSQEHSLPPHLQHTCHLYSTSDEQPPVSSLHPFSQSSLYYSSGQKSSRFSPSSSPMPQAGSMAEQSS